MFKGAIIRSFTTYECILTIIGYNYLHSIVSGDYEKDRDNIHVNIGIPKRPSAIQCMVLYHNVVTEMVFHNN